MSPRQRHRLGYVVLFAIGMAGAAALMFRAFEQNLLFFFTPTQVVQGKVVPHRPFRIGGLVLEDSVVHHSEDLRVTFEVTDTLNSVPVTYVGVLPDLFREGQGVVVHGELATNGSFSATEVLAKHDENYLPPEAAAAIEAARTLQGN